LKFAQQAPNTKIFFAPGSYHEILNEKENIRNAATKMIVSFLRQEEDDVSVVQAVKPITATPHRGGGSGGGGCCSGNLPKLLLLGFGIPLLMKSAICIVQHGYK
jgi:hypothetical protein